MHVVGRIAALIYKREINCLVIHSLPTMKPYTKPARK